MEKTKNKKKFWLGPASVQFRICTFYSKQLNFVSSQFKWRLSVKITATTWENLWLYREWVYTRYKTVQQAFWKCVEQSSGCKNKKYQLPNHCWKWDIRYLDWRYPVISMTHQGCIIMYDWPSRCKKTKTKKTCWVWISKNSNPLQRCVEVQTGHPGRLLCLQLLVY